LIGIRTPFPPIALLIGFVPDVVEAAILFILIRQGRRLATTISPSSSAPVVSIVYSAKIGIIGHLIGKEALRSSLRI